MSVITEAAVDDAGKKSTPFYLRHVPAELNQRPSTIILHACSFHSLNFFKSLVALDASKFNKREMLYLKSMDF